MTITLRSRGWSAILTACLLLLLPQLVAAQQGDSFYVGYAFGEGRFSNDAVAGGFGSGLAEAVTTQKLFVGMPVNEFLAMELAYADLGEAPELGNGGTKIGAKAITVTALLNAVASERLSFFFRAGVARWNTDVVLDYDQIGEYGSGSAHGVGYVVGLGTDLMVTGILTFRLEVEQVGQVAASQTIVLQPSTTPVYLSASAPRMLALAVMARF